MEARLRASQLSEDLCLDTGSAEQKAVVGRRRLVCFGVRCSCRWIARCVFVRHQSPLYTAKRGSGRRRRTDDDRDASRSDDQAARTWRARGPLSLRSISKLTRSSPARFSKVSELSSPLRWKKYSCPSSAVMKPKPRSATIFLTVPVTLVSPIPSRYVEQTQRVRSRRNDDHERYPSRLEVMSSPYPNGTRLNVPGRENRHPGAADSLAGTIGSRSQCPRGGHLVGFVSRAFKGRPRDQPRDARIPPGQYLVRDFPVLSAGPTPHTSLAEWSFSIEGEVDEEKHWSWEELRALPSETVTRDIHCVTKWSKLDTAWEGVSVDTLLQGVETAAEDVMAFCDGGYTTNLPLEDLTGGKAWIAFAFDGQPLESQP